MKLFTDYADPYELTLTARVGFDEREEQQGSLSAYLPNRTVPGTTIELAVGSNGLNEVAEFRSFDAENSFGEGPGGEFRTVRLAPLGQQARVSEWDQLQMRNIKNSDLLTETQLKVAKRLGEAIADRIELARGQVMQSGKFMVNENGFINTTDFGRDESFSVTAANKWNTDEAKPLDDLEAWVEAYVDHNGIEPGGLVLSKKARAALKKSAQIQKIATNGAVAQIVNDAFVDGILADYGLPQLISYDRRVRRGGKAVPILDPSTPVFVPPAELEAGVTAMGTTLESTESNYSIPLNEQPGIAVGAYKSENPIGVYINGAAIAMPVLANANAFMAVKVLD